MDVVNNINTMLTKLGGPNFIRRGGCETPTHRNEYQISNIVNFKDNQYFFVVKL